MSVLAVTLHNIPEETAVGVALAATGHGTCPPVAAHWLYLWESPYRNTESLSGKTFQRRDGRSRPGLRTDDDSGHRIRINVWNDIP